MISFKEYVLIERELGGKDGSVRDIFARFMRTINQIIDMIKFAKTPDGGKLFNATNALMKSIGGHRTKMFMDAVLNPSGFTQTKELASILASKEGKVIMSILGAREKNPTDDGETEVLGKDVNGKLQYKIKQVFSSGGDYQKMVSVANKMIEEFPESVQSMLFDFMHSVVGDEISESMFGILGWREFAKMSMMVFFLRMVQVVSNNNVELDLKPYILKITALFKSFDSTFSDTTKVSITSLLNFARQFTNIVGEMKNNHKHTIQTKKPA